MTAGTRDLVSRGLMLFCIGTCKLVTGALIRTEFAGSVDVVSRLATQPLLTHVSVADIAVTQTVSLLELTPYALNPEPFM